MVVADADGTLLSVRGSVLVRGRAADEMNFAEGRAWSEAGAGTNAVGTAIAAGHAVQVFAAEHFADPVQRWTCAAAPVRDPEDGRVIGVIDLTGDFTGVHPHSLAVVVATAQAVEVFLRCRMHEHDDAAALALRRPARPGRRAQRAGDGVRPRALGQRAPLGPRRAAGDPQGRR